MGGRLGILVSSCLLYVAHLGVGGQWRAVPVPKRLALILILVNG